MGFFSGQGAVYYTAEAAADLSALQYCAVKVDSTGKIAACTSAGENAIGILQNKPTSGQMAQVLCQGVSKVRVAAAVGEMVNLKVAGSTSELTTASAAVTDTSDGGAASDPLIGSYVIATTLEEASGNDSIIAALVSCPGSAIPTTAA